MKVAHVGLLSAIVVRGQVVLRMRPYQQSATRDVALTRQKISFNPVSPQLCAAVSPSLLAGRGSPAEALNPGPADPGSNSNSAAAGGGGKLGYIRVATFSKQTGEGVRAALEQLRASGAERCCTDELGALLATRQMFTRCG